MQTKSPLQKIVAWLRAELRILKSILKEPHHDDVSAYPVIH